MERKEFYIVIEDQVMQNGEYGLLHNHYEDINMAYSKYYTVLAAAAVSTIPYHSAYMLRSDGSIVDYKVFDRRNI